MLGICGFSSDVLILWVFAFQKNTRETGNSRVVTRRSYVNNFKLGTASREKLMGLRSLRLIPRFLSRNKVVENTLNC